MSQYVLSEDADRDLDEIWEYIAEDKLDAADRWIEKLFDAFEAIGNAPGIGHKQEDLTGLPVLFFPVGAYLIIFVKDTSLSKSSLLRKARAIYPRSCNAD